MKKSIMLVLLVMAAMISIAQTKVPEVTPNGYISEPSYVYIGGTSADTLTNGDTLTYVLRIMGNRTYDIKSQLYLDHVSGTAGGKLKTYKSINGVTYVVTSAADSITATSVTSDGLDTEELTFSDYMSPYLKFIYIQTGAAKTVPKIYIYAKEN